MANLSSSTTSAAPSSNAYLARKQGLDLTIDLGFTPRNTIHQGDCIRLMTGMEANSVDFILTDLPCITRYRGLVAARSPTTTTPAG